MTVTHSHSNLLGEPPATLLPGDPEAEASMTARVVQACQNLRSAGTHR